ncbi:NRDE family protein [Aestuariibaculum suncheonense]|uniref:NRDE family protein n=1 Tax=Aestuariibaculum suncheonense TaxID=1028745 RepID=A0A8J6Q9W9_9FLAO|nr:NRDE family protein [Aestuariibaculum suncheonense]MBD0836377.1 NRDE family protein [Aestuariibaculum suncheonense]
MCTVTLIPKEGNDFVLTSNRDEAPDRGSSFPEIYIVDDTKVLFPKDEISGGTWIGISEQNRVVCLLNGGFERHERKVSYRLSRGVVATDFMTFKDVEGEISVFNFSNIEPFTMVIVDWNTHLKFFELVWDGETKHFKQLPLKEHIWSSTTLYTKAMKTERQSWFEDFKTEHELTAETLLQFHKTAGQGNLDYGVIMDRGFVKTTSITQIEKSNRQLGMRYKNLFKGETSYKALELPQTVNE